MGDAEQDDALIEELLDEALEGYEGVVPAELLAAMRAHIGDTLAATASGKRLLRQVRPDPVLSRSADLELPQGAGERAQPAAAVVGIQRGKRS